MDHTELAETESGPVFIRRPILGLAIAFVLGTLPGLACEPLGAVAIRITIGALLIAIILSALSGMRRRGSEAFAFQSSFCGACLYVSILSLGCANAALRGAPHEPESLSAAVLQAENVELEGWINGYPQSMDSSFAHLNSWSVPFRIERTRVKRRKWEPTQRDVRVFWNERVGSR